jgi:hypothetical protein
VPVGAVAPGSLFGIPSLFLSFLFTSPGDPFATCLSGFDVRDARSSLSFILVNVAAFREETTSPDLPEAVLLIHYSAKILTQACITGDASRTTLTLTRSFSSSILDHFFSLI